MSLTKPFTIVGSMTLLSRVTGFIRDILIAAILGTSAIADVYVAAFLIPNLIRRMMSEGAFNAAIIPRLARLEKEGGLQAARGYSDDVLALLSVVAIVLVALAELFMPAIMTALAGGFRAEPAKFEDAVLFARIAFPFVGLILIVALMSALLNAVERYAIAALVPVVLNLLLIGVLVALLMIVPVSQRQAGLFLVATVLAAGLIQLVLLWIAAARAGFDVTPRPWDALRGRIDPGAKTLLLLAVPGMVIAGSGHVHMVIASQFASLEARGVSLLYFADRLFQLPLGFVASAIGVVLLPRLSRALHQGDAAGMIAAQGESLVFAALLILPAAAGLYVLSDPIVSILFQRQAFMAEDARATAANLRILVLALPAFVLVKTVLPGFLAHEEMKTPLIVVLVALGVNALSVFVFLSLGMKLAPVMGVAVGVWVNALLLLAFAGRRFAVSWTALRRVLGALVAAAMMAGVVTMLRDMLAGFLDAGQLFGVRSLVLGILCLIGIAVHLVCARILGAIDPTLLRWRRGAPHP